MNEFEFNKLYCKLSALVEASGGGAITGETVDPVRTEVTTSGSTTAGIMSVSITNVGEDPGEVAGIPLLPGETWEASGYYDSQTKTFNRLNAVDYVASATAILHISELP